MKVCIIGGGASGLYCAMQLKHTLPSADICVLEKNPRVGKKLLTTGNGKCNFTNLSQSSENYSSESSELALDIISRHTPDAIMSAFSSIGVESTTKDGLVYPKSMQASSVLDALRYKAEALGVTFKTDFAVKNIKFKNNKYILSAEEQEECDILVIATGTGANGGTNAGLKFLRAFGHSAAELYPALVPLVCDTTNTKIAKGMRARCKVTLMKNGNKIASEYGEVLFTDYGISGICILNLSRHVAQSHACGEHADFRLSLDFTPESELQDLIAYYKERKDKLSYLQTGEFFTGYINKKIGQALLKTCGINDFTTTADNLTDAQLIQLAQKTKAFEMTVVNTLDASHAQVCGGGIRLGEFNDHLQSKIQKNLYACGEVLDVIGDCGGYNLTWAWASAYAVAQEIAEKA